MDPMKLFLYVFFFGMFLVGAVWLIMPKKDKK